MQSVLCTTFVLLSVALLACASDVPIGTSRQALEGMGTEGFCTPAHCRDSDIACPATVDPAHHRIIHLRCVPNPQAGSGVGTCRLEGECVPEESSAATTE